jgi:hypothetical protein
MVERAFAWLVFVALAVSLMLEKPVPLAIAP